MTKIAENETEFKEVSCFFPLHQFPAEKEGKNVLLLVGTPFEEKKNYHLYISFDFVFVLFCIRNVLNIFVQMPNCAKKIIQIIWGSKNQNIYLFMLLSLYIAYFRVLRTFQSKFFVENHATVFLFFLYAKLRNDEKMRPTCDQRKSDKMPYINGSDSDSQSRLE